MMSRSYGRFFVIWLLVAATAVMVSHWYVLKLVDQEAQLYTFNQVRVQTNDVLSDIEANFDRIAEYGLFASTVLPRLTELDSRLEVIALDGRLLFDSEDSSAWHTGQLRDLRFNLHYDMSARSAGIVPVTFPVLVEGTQRANAVFYLPSELIFHKGSPGSLLTIQLPLFSVIILASGAFIFMHFHHQRTRVEPLRELDKAVKDITRGHLDVKISSPGDPELSTLSRSVDILRLELRDVLSRQSDVEKSRKELITKIAHDLKTPISSIKAYVEGLKKGIASEPHTVVKYLSVIDRKTDSLTTLIDDLLEHSLQELGQLSIHREEHYSRDLLKNILEPIRVQFAAGPVSFHIEKDIPDVLINVDKRRLEQVVVNLVENARKYTAAGGKIFFSAENEEQHLRICVRDTGHGVSARELPHIFDSFYRSPEVARDFEGAGLGLAISKYIVQQHGGRIWVESKLNEGSTFTFTIAKT